MKKCGKVKRKPKYSLLDMIFDRKERAEIYNHYDLIYQETEDENEIFMNMRNMRKLKVVEDE